MKQDAWTTDGDVLGMLPMDAARKQQLEDCLQTIDRIIGAPQHLHTRQLIYILVQISRIGQLAQEIYQIKSIYHGAYDEILLITPPLDSAVNREVFRIFTRGMQWFPCSQADVLNLGWEDFGTVRRSNRIYALYNPSTLYRPQFEQFAKGLPPQYVSLSAEDEDRGLALRRALNIPRNAPIVTLHVREPGYLPQSQHNSYRDANLATYIPAITMLVEHGYYIVRLGDSTMQRLSAHPQILDMPFHPSYEPFVEPYFIWTSLFYLGTFSGPYSIARAFNKPILTTNGHIQSMLICGDEELLVYKKYFSHTLGRLLTYHEVILSPIVDFTLTEQFINYKVQIINNTDEEIWRAAAEIIQRLEGIYKETTAILAQNRADDAMAHTIRASAGGPFPYFAPALSQARLSEEYILCNPYLLGHRAQVTF